jgi:glycerophosphoryl diester phosphodiesterase
MARPSVLVSAHGGGAVRGPDPDGTRLALEQAVALGVDYVELDVRRSRDGVLLLCHDRELLVGGRLRAVADVDADELADAVPGLLRLDEALEVLTGRAGAHLDLKFRSPGSVHELAAATRSLDVLGPGEVLVTTSNARAIRAIRDWSVARGRPLLTGLSIGGSVAGRPPLEQLRLRHGELFPADRFVESRAEAVVANHWLALASLARFARRAGLPLVVWTVDHPVLLRYWMRPGRAWLVTTNRPERALAIRAGRNRSEAGAD